MTGQSGALTLQPLVLTAAWKTFLRQCSAGDVTVDSRDNLSHWHHHSAGAVGEVKGGDGKATGQGGLMGGVTITNGPHRMGSLALVFKSNSLALTTI